MVQCYSLKKRRADFKTRVEVTCSVGYVAKVTVGAAIHTQVGLRGPLAWSHPDNAYVLPLILFLVRSHYRIYLLTNHCD